MTTSPFQTKEEVQAALMEELKEHRRLYGFEKDWHASRELSNRMWDFQIAEQERINGKAVMALIRAAAQAEEEIPYEELEEATRR